MRSGVCVLGYLRHGGYAPRHVLAVPLPPQLDVVSSKQISLCGFPVNASQGELVNMDEVFFFF